MYDKEQLIAMERELVDLWEAGQIKVPCHFCGGNEEQLIEIFKEVKRDDYVFCSHRNHYHYLLHGGSFEALKRGMLGLPDGLCRGRAGSMGTIDPRINFYSSAIVGGLVNVAVGAAWSLKDSASSRKVWCFVGDGVLDGGHFWEALQYAQGWDLPITFVVEDNDRSTCTDIKSRLGSGWVLPIIKQLRRYEYSPTWPHVSSGKYVQF